MCVYVNELRQKIAQPPIAWTSAYEERKREDLKKKIGQKIMSSMMILVDDILLSVSNPR